MVEGRFKPLHGGAAELASSLLAHFDIKKRAGSEPAGTIGVNLSLWGEKDRMKWFSLLGK